MPVGRPGPVMIAAVVAGVLVLFGIGAVALPAIFSGGSSGALPAQTGAPATRQGADVPVADPASALPSVAPTSPARTTTAPAGNGDAALENDMVRLVNEERAKARCRDLRQDDRLRDAARTHSADMAAKNFVDHRGSDGSSPADRMTAAGYPDGQAMGETLARGGGDARGVLRSWLRNKDNRAIILDCDARALGVGVVLRGRTAYWTQNLGRS